MSDLVKIGDVELAPVEYCGNRVMTLSMMDAAHKRPDGTAGRNFRENRERLIEGEDFHKVSADEIRRHKICAISSKAREDMILLTETGYSMLVKSFTDDLAWEVQRQLVRSYFSKRVDATSEVSQFEVAMHALKLAPLAVSAAEAFGFDKNVATISANQYICSVTGQNLLKGFGQTHLLAENQNTQWFTPTQLRAESGMSARKLNSALEAAGFQQRRDDVWELLPAGQPYARLFDTGKRHEKGLMVQQIRWSPTVLEALKSVPAVSNQGSLLGGGQ